MYELLRIPIHSNFWWLCDHDNSEGFRVDNEDPCTTCGVLVEKRYSLDVNCIFKLGHDTRKNNIANIKTATLRPKSISYIDNYFHCKEKLCERCWKNQKHNQNDKLIMKTLLMTNVKENSSAYSSISKL